MLIAGDALFGVSTRLRTGVFAPPKVDQPEPVSCRVSIQRLAELRPDTIVFGHGPPWRDTRKFVDFVNALPR